MFYDVVERKNACLGYKNKKFKKSKNCNFSKGVSPWFWLKIGTVLVENWPFFQTFSYGN